LIRDEERKFESIASLPVASLLLHFSQKWIGKRKLNYFLFFLSTIQIHFKKVEQNKKDVIHNEDGSFNTGERAQIFGA